MVYVLCKHKKTNEERKFTEPVFRANEHKYKFVEYTESPSAPKKAATTTGSTSAQSITIHPKKITSEEFKTEAPKAPTAPIVDETRAALAEQYEALAGKAAKKN